MTPLSSLSLHPILVYWNSSLAGTYISWQDADLSPLVPLRVHQKLKSSSRRSSKVMLFGAKASSGNSARDVGAGATILELGIDRRGLALVKPVCTLL